MKLLLLLVFIFFGFLSISKEEIRIKPYENKCPYQFKELKDLVEKQKYFYDSTYYNNYAFNAQNCKIRTATEGNKCCYISLLYNNNWYDFCAEVKIEEGINNLLDSAFEEEEREEEEREEEEEEEDEEEKKKREEEEKKRKELERKKREKIKEQLKKKINIDCFDIKLNIIKSFIFILLTLLI